MKPSIPMTLVYSREIGLQGSSLTNPPWNCTDNTNWLFGKYFSPSKGFHFRSSPNKVGTMSYIIQRNWQLSMLVKLYSFVFLWTSTYKRFPLIKNYPAIVHDWWNILWKQEFYFSNDFYSILIWLGRETILLQLIPS